MQDATEASIFVPALDAHDLAACLLAAVKPSSPSHYEAVRTYSGFNDVGKQWAGAVVVSMPGGERLRITTSGRDAEAAANNYSMPSATKTGAWAYLHCESRNSCFVDYMKDVAERVGGFLQYEKRRTQREGGTLVGPWIAPDIDCEFEGIDRAKHRLMRELGFDSAPIVERMLRVPETLELVLDTLNEANADMTATPFGRLK